MSTSLLVLILLLYCLSCLICFYVGRSKARIIKEKPYIVANKSIMLGTQLLVTFKDRSEKNLYALIQVKPKRAQSMSEVHSYLEEATLVSAKDIDVNGINFKNELEDKIKIYLAKHLMHTEIEKLNIVF